MWLRNPILRAGVLFGLVMVIGLNLHAQNLVLTPLNIALVGKHPEGLTVGDFNGDGRLDVVTANSSSDDLTILLGNGNGTFRSSVSFGVGKSPMGLASGDINADGFLDLVVAAAGLDSLLTLFGNGEGLFQSPVRYHTGQRPTFLAVSDLDQDNDLDAVVVNSGWLGNYPPFSLSILFNQGSGQLGRPTMLTRVEDDGLFPTSVYIADHNDDGFPDLAVTWSQPSWRSPNGGVSIFRNKGDGHFVRSQEVPAGFTLSAITGADLNRDGKLDLVVASLHSDSVIVLHQEDDGTFSIANKLKVGFSPVGVAVDDFNGDELLDIAVTNRASNSASVLLGTEHGGYRSAGHFGVGMTPTSLAVEDFDRDGYPDLLTSNSGSDDISILLSGTQGIPSMNLSADSIEFGERKREGVQEKKTLILSNIGLGPLTISKVILGGMDPEAFEVVDDQCLGNTLGTGHVCHLIISFKANTLGIHQAEVRILDNAPGGPRLIFLQGTVKG